MKSLHVRRNFLKLAKRIGLFGFSALGAGTAAVSLGSAQSAQSKQTSDSEQMQKLLDRLTNLEQKLVQQPLVIDQVKPNAAEQVKPNAVEQVKPNAVEQVKPNVKPSVDLGLPIFFMIGPAIVAIAPR